MKKILILGAGSHAKVVFFEIMQIKNYEVLGFADNYITSGKLIVRYKNKSYYNLGVIKNVLKKYHNTSFYGVIGIGSNYLRKKISKEVENIDRNFKWTNIISVNSKITGNVKIGKGSVVISGSIINNASVIGKHCLINTSCSIDHDNFFNNYSSSGPGVVTGGNVKIGYLSHLGIGSVIKNKVKIGNNTIIGGNSFVNKDCLDNSIYFGVPSKRIRKINIKKDFNY